MKNQVEITANESTTLIDIMADVDFELDGDPGDELDFAEALHKIVLARCVGQAKLAPGHYNVRLLAVITENAG